MLDKIGFTGNVAGLFYSGVDPNNPEDLRSCEWAFKNLTLHFIESNWPSILSLVRFDSVKTLMMLRRFYRDAFGVARFHSRLQAMCSDETLRSQILTEVERLSIRINARKPRKTRVAAAFSLWMATFRPIYLDQTPSVPEIWCLDGVVNFYIATSYLGLFGDIVVGIPGRDRDVRLQRIFYDFTCRNINLSSLEMLYCSIFRPRKGSEEEQEGVVPTPNRRYSAP